MRPAIWVLTLLCGTAAATPATAQKWVVSEEESVTLEYRNAADTASILSVSCHTELSDIVVPINPGTKPPTTPPELKITEKGTTRTMKLTVEVCGGELTCTDRPNGEVSTYYVRQKQKLLALRFAEKATAISIDAPGAAIKANADKAAFAKFVSLCKKHK